MYTHVYNTYTIYMCDYATIQIQTHMHTIHTYTDAVAAHCDVKDACAYTAHLCKFTSSNAFGA